MTTPLTPTPPTTALPPTLRLLVALAALAMTLHLAHPPPPTTSVPASVTKSRAAITDAWFTSLLAALHVDRTCLPSDVDPDQITESAVDQRDDWTDADKLAVARLLVEAGLAPDPGTEGKSGSVIYSPLERALAHGTLMRLCLDAGTLLPQAEKDIALTLFSALKAVDSDAAVEEARAARSEGWGGTLGRRIATGAGVLAGGVLLGVTGGLAAPAIAAVLAPLGLGTVLSATAAPVVLGTLFGVGGGGLAGRRVSERWRGVDEFGFVPVGAGTRATEEEINDLREARREQQKREKELETKKRAAMEGKDSGGGNEERMEDGTEDVAEKEKGALQDIDSEEDAREDVERGRQEIEARLLELSLEAGTRSSFSSPISPLRQGPLPSLDAPQEEKPVSEINRPPSLTPDSQATIVVPGLMTVSKTEGITAWRALCSSNRIGIDHVPQKSGLRDGRDVYLLRYETATMLKTGQDVDYWVASKLKGLVKKEIIKRTLLSAYFAAVSLPLSVYSMATLTLDNTWMKAQDRAVKAGRLLGEVLEKRVQGERPVVLVGSSVGALTVLHALLYLSTLGPNCPSPVESAYLVSLPSAPTSAEWTRARTVVARRLVNAWTGADLVLAGVVRLHEVVSRAAVGSNGIRVAGLGPVNQSGVEDVDVSDVLRGHTEIQAKMADVLEVIKIDS